MLLSSYSLEFSHGNCQYRGFLCLKSQFLFMYALVAMQENKLAVLDSAFVSRLELLNDFNAAVKIYAS